MQTSSNWSLCIKWNSFRMIKLINKQFIEHQSIVYYRSVVVRFDKTLSGISVF